MKIENVVTVLAILIFLCGVCTGHQLVAAAPAPKCPVDFNKRVALAACRVLRPLLGHDFFKTCRRAVKACEKASAEGEHVQDLEG